MDSQENLTASIEENVILENQNDNEIGEENSLQEVLDNEKQRDTQNEDTGEPDNISLETDDETLKEPFILDGDKILIYIKEDVNDRVVEGILEKYPCNFKIKVSDGTFYIYKNSKINTLINDRFFYSALGIGVVSQIQCRIKKYDENGPREFIGDIDNLTILPDILLPLDDERAIDLRDIEEKDKYKSLFNHLHLVKSTHSEANIKEIANFINQYVFEFPLTQDEINNIVDKVNSLYLEKSNTTKVFKTLDEYEEREIEWLFYPYIPLGAITILGGDPGCGKSYLSVAFASIVSNGNKFPFESEDTPKNEPAMVVMQNGEDGIEDSIKPRLTRAGANQENVGVIVEETELLTFSDLDKIERTLEYRKPKLIIFDPVQRYMGNVNLNSLTEVTNTLKGLSKLAQKYNCAILLIMHLNKGQNKGIYRLNGSVGLPGIARSVLMVQDLKDTDDKALVHVKSNLAKKGMAVIFEITDNGIIFKEQVPESSLNPSSDKEVKTSQKDIAKNFIKEILKNGELESTVIRNEAHNSNIAPATLERAKAELSCVKSFQKDKKWYWKLKDDETSDNHISNNEEEVI